MKREIYGSACLVLLITSFAMLFAGCGDNARGVIVGRWQDSTGAVMEFRSDGIAVGHDGAESKWSIAPLDEDRGILTLGFGDIVFEFEYALSGETLTLTPITLAGETELAPQVSTQTVLTRVRD